MATAAYTPKIETYLNDDPLARVKGESHKANVALKDYALMGPGRGLRALALRYREQYEKGQILPPTRRPATLRRWSVQFLWQSRVGRFDEINYELNLEKWQYRREALLEAEWGDGAALRERATECLNVLPLFLQGGLAEVTDPASGKKIRVLRQQVNVGLHQIAVALKQASALQRLATDSPTEHVKLSGHALDGVIRRELEMLLMQMNDNPTEEETEDAANGTPTLIG